MAKERLIVIGGDAAGMSAASVARRRRADLEIVVFEKGAFTSYSACGIPYHASGQVEKADSLIARSPEAFRKGNIDVRIRSEVVGIELKSRRVKVKDLASGDERWEPFDLLLIATGATPIVPRVEGITAPGVFSISGLQSGLDLRQALDRQPPRRAVVVGGGYLGIEMAEALRLRGAEVALVERAPQVMLSLDADMAKGVAERLVESGIDLHLGETLTGIELDNHGRARAVTTDHRAIEAEVVILGLGIRPNTSLASECGIPLGERDSVKVSDRMRTEIEGIWAAGDCAQSHHLVSGRPTWIALGTVANKHGRVAGINISGGEASFPGVVGTAITKFFELEIARTGLSEHELQLLHVEYLTAEIEARTRAHYYPEGAPVKVKLLCDKGNGRLLGSQILGGPGSGKRIDVVATALHAGLTVAQLIDLDLAYAPPFSPVWDPVQTAARVLLGKTGGNG